MTRALLLVLVCAAAVLAGLWAVPASATAPYLMDLHLHGSLSERHGTMTNHTREAEAAGYDGLWWTDHAERLMASGFVHRVRFEGSLAGEPRAGYSTPNGEFLLSESSAGLANLQYLSTQPPEGAEFLRMSFSATPSGSWDSAALSYQGLKLLHRVSLLAEPRVRLHLRTGQVTGDAGFVLRAEFSSVPDGVSELGVPHVIEYVAPGSVLPPPDPSTVRVNLTSQPPWNWSVADLDLAADVAAAFPLAPDLGLREVSLLLVGRAGGSVEWDVDDFRLELEGPTDLQLLRAQRDYLRQRLAQNLQHEIGMEIAGPEHLGYPDNEDHEHLVALFPGDVPELLYLTTDNPDSYRFPNSAVSWVQERGGVAILAHPFGSMWPPAGISPQAGLLQADEIVAARAWDADGIEVGYVQRGRPLDDHLKVWDRLGGAGVYVTGVGVTDNHTVQPWSLRPNRMGSWIRSTGSDAAHLVAAIRAGDLFFGDPHRFDPQGDFLLADAHGQFRMGDVVVQRGPRLRSFRAIVNGAQAGWQFVLLHNGAETARSPVFPNPSYQWFHPLTVAPGDWVRLELRDAADAAILFSNPIYFARLGQPVPEHRRP